MLKRGKVKKHHQAKCYQRDYRFSDQDDSSKQFGDSFLSVEHLRFSFRIIHCGGHWLLTNSTDELLRLKGYADERFKKPGDAYTPL